MCRESYHLGSHFGTILGPFGDGLGVKMVFLVILGLLNFGRLVPAHFSSYRDDILFKRCASTRRIFLKPSRGSLLRKKNQNVKKKLIILGLLKFVKKSPIKPVLGNNWRAIIIIIIPAGCARIILLETRTSLLIRSAPGMLGSPLEAFQRSNEVCSWGRGLLLPTARRK